jgi:hypothetical protein
MCVILCSACVTDLIGTGYISERVAVPKDIRSLCDLSEVLANSVKCFIELCKCEEHCVVERCDRSLEGLKYVCCIFCCSLGVKKFASAAC